MPSQEVPAITITTPSSRSKPCVPPLISLAPVIGPGSRSAAEPLGQRPPEQPEAEREATNDVAAEEPAGLVTEAVDPLQAQAL